MEPARAPVAAVVLAAGASTRMGEPKALLRWRGRAFLTHVVEGARAAGCSPVVVVEGAVELPADVVGDATRVENEAWREGQLSSLQRGIRAAQNHDPSAVLVLTVDRPHIQVSTLVALVAAHREEPRTIWQPAFEGRRGHPILYPSDLVPALLDLGRGDSPRVLLGRPEVAARRKTVDVDDRAVLENLDRPEDLERLA